MKKSFLILHILIFAWMQFAPIHLQAREGEQQQLQLAVPPADYRIAETYVIDSSTSNFHFKFKDQVGMRVEVDGYMGRVGASWGPDFKQSMYTLEQQFPDFKDKVIKILTLPTTWQDAEIYKKKLEGKYPNHKIVIMNIPTHIQSVILEEATQQAQGRLKYMMWKLKKGAKLATDPKALSKAISNAYQIVKNQYVKPTSRDLKIAAITATITGGASATAMFYSVGLEPLTMSAIGTTLAVEAAKQIIQDAAIVGIPVAFAQFIGNLMNADITSEANVVSGLRKIAANIGKSALLSGDLDPRALMAESLNTVVTTKATEEEEKRFNQETRLKLFWYTFAMGTAISVMGKLGVHTPWDIDYVIKLGGLQSASIVITGLLFLAYKYKASIVEQFVRTDKTELIKVKWTQTVGPLRARTLKVQPRATAYEPMVCVRLFQ